MHYLCSHSHIGYVACPADNQKRIGTRIVHHGNHGHRLLIISRWDIAYQLLF